ncbi:MAG TPA: hypothetical protein VN682_15335 [Terriglobales bacterium]|jgi:hypothetical protein|nr:hypothetical protein [Terriglobales bacterium]
MTESIGKIQRPNVPQKLLIFVLAVVSVSPVGRTQNAKSEQVNKPNLQLSVRADRSSYSLKDKLHMEVQLTNVGNSDIYVWDWIFCWGQGSAISIHAFDDKGKMVQPVSGFLIDCVPPPPKEHDTTQFIRLEPGRFYGVSEDFDMRDLVDGPGNRILTISIGGVLSRDFLHKFGYPDLPYWTSDDKPLSARISIRVTK